jgi:type IV pilus assembly protein PilM
MLPVAIDISDTLIRLVTLERRGRGLRMHVRADIVVPDGYIVDGDIKQPAAVTELLQSLINAADPKAKSVEVALPERHTFVKLISLPADNTQPLEQAVTTALSQHIPYTPDEVYWDWSKTNRLNSLNQPQALIGAAPKTTVDEYLHLFQSVGLRVDAAEIESVAITRAMFGPQPPNDTRLVLDLGRTRSTIILVDNGVVQMSSTLRYAGRELNQFIADELHITNEQAERAKTLFGLDPKRGKGVLRAVLAPHIDAIADAIADVEAYFQEHFIDHRPITHVHCTGSGALIRGISDELQKRLDQSVIVEPSWAFSTLLQKQPDLPTELGFTYTTVLGLALRPLFPSVT